MAVAKMHVVQVGTGRWGSNWAQEILPTVPTIEVTAHVDANPDALKALQERLLVPPEKCFASLRAALDAVPCDIVLGTLRTEAHFAVMAEALEAGRHAIVEKPFASTLEEAASLVRLAAARNLLLMVSQNYRFYRSPRLVARLLAEGRIGQVDMVAIDFRRHAPSMGFAYYDFPDPLLADMSIHHFDLMRMVLGREAVRVSARAWNPKGSPFAHPPAGVVTLEFEGGIVISYRGSWMSGGADTPWSGLWSINGSEGELEWACRGDAGSNRSAVDWATLRPIGQEKQQLPLDDLPFYDRAGTVAGLAEAVRTGTMPPYFSSGADNLHSLALVKACVRSNNEGGAWIHPRDLLPSQGHQP